MIVKMMVVVMMMMIEPTVDERAQVRAAPHPLPPSLLRGVQHGSTYESKPNLAAMRPPDKATAHARHMHQLSAVVLRADASDHQLATCGHLQLRKRGRELTKILPGSWNVRAEN